MMCTRPAGPNCVKLLLLVSAPESQHGGGEKEEGKRGGLEDRRAEQAVPGEWEKALYPFSTCAAPLGKSCFLCLVQKTSVWSCQIPPVFTNNR